MTKEEVQHYDVFSFRPPPSTEANHRTSELVREVLDSFFVRKSGTPSFSEVSLGIFCEAVGTFEALDSVEERDAFVASLRDGVQRTARRGIWGFDGSNMYTTELRDKVLMPLYNLERSRLESRARGAGRGETASRAE